MIILLLGIVLCISLLVYFYMCYLKASVFLRMGFVNDEIPIGRVKLNKYFTLASFGDQKYEK